MPAEMQKLCRICAHVFIYMWSIEVITCHWFHLVLCLCGELYSQYTSPALSKYTTMLWGRFWLLHSYSFSKHTQLQCHAIWYGARCFFLHFSSSSSSILLIFKSVLLLNFTNCNLKMPTLHDTIGVDGDEAAPELLLMLNIAGSMLHSLDQ